MNLYPDLMRSTPVTSLGRPLQMDDASFGALRPSNDIIEDGFALRQRLDEEGYLYLQQAIPVHLVRDARLSVLRKLKATSPGLFDPLRPLEEGVLAHSETDIPGSPRTFRPDLATGDEAVYRLVFGSYMEDFYTRLFGVPVRHFDYIWLRAMEAGPGTASHCDWVYMGRGSPDLLTCWIPYGDVSLDVGGLMLLEGSHRLAPRLKSYLERDVDSYCINNEDERQRVAVQGGWSHKGWLSDRADQLPRHFGGRWLTAPCWQMGDFITFKMTMVHGSLDNQSNLVRISSDTRWQPADHPVDERWVGDEPVGHSVAGKRGRIC